MKPTLFRAAAAMERPARTKKSVDYAQFDNDDEDFTFATAPPSKKPRIKDAQPKKEKKMKPLSKKPQKEQPAFQQRVVIERIPLDEKLYQRDLEVALALSVQASPVEGTEVQASPSIETCTDTETDDMDCVPLLSNCSVDSDLLGLDTITDVQETEPGGRSRRHAASKALSEQRKMLIDDSGDEEKLDDYKPDFASDIDSESDSDFSDDTEFEIASKKIKKSKEDKKKETKLKVPFEKQKKSPKSRPNATATPAVSTSSVIKIKCQPVLKKTYMPSEPVESLSQASSPPVGMKKPSWNPPTPSGNGSNALRGVAVKSPNQGLRLGLSRFARVKPLHPSVANS